MDITDPQKKLNILIERCQEISQEIGNILKDKKENLEKQAQLKKNLQDVQEKVEAAHVEEAALEDRIQAAVGGPNENGRDFVQKMCLLLGYQMSNCRLLPSPNGGVQRKLLYASNCSVTYNEFNRMLYELVDVHPPHPEFAEIRQFLQDSQDLKGLLTSLKKFFDQITTENSENEIL
ncbi:uncharacterized protein LOC106093050 [Stomoxys calcitrans]|uniref:Uncharacterized protein n=1 Tax=Stomoxys calcitrans TaxID=35570 RepID=A0A1I8NNL8_STOCA|nr:uncharacterized protein LOC106093050 [Stomoxys calcitrans]